MVATERYELRLRPEGIRFVGLIYSNHRLQLIRKKMGHNAVIQFRYHPEHTKEIFAYDEERRELFAVPCLSQEYTKGLTFYQHKLIMKMAVDNGKRNPSIQQMLMYRDELAKLVSQMRWSSKLKERRKAARIDSEGSLPQPSKQSSPIVVVTELENMLAEIEDILVDVNDDGWEFPVL